jgi:hypothetical protein
MFTWPNERIKNTVPPPVPPGKTVKKSQWQLQLLLEPGYMIDYTNWVNADQTFPKALLEVLVNDQLLTQHTLSGNPETVTVNIDDQSEFATQTIRIRITGLEPTQLTNSGHPMLKIQAHIEQLALSEIIEEIAQYKTYNNDTIKAGTEFLGQDGELLLTVECPIYVWIMQQIGKISPYKYFRFGQIEV